MNYIIGFLAVILGFLMDFFFRGLTLIGYPRLWACIVLYAAATRFLFLPQRIKNFKSKMLTPYINRELLFADPDFFSKTTNTELTLERAALKRETYKRYKISNRSGCLITLIQYPFLVALFYVVKNPQQFISSLESLSSVSAQVNTFLGVSLAAIPFNSLQDPETSPFILCVPLLVMLSNVIKMLPSIKLAKTVVQKLKVYGLCIAFTLLLGWFSGSLPLAISLYWITNDVTYHIFDIFIRRCVPKSKSVLKALKMHDEKMAELAKARTEAATETGEDSKEEVSSNEEMASEIVETRIAATNEAQAK
jgi:YidC/Oxa1 family membrane protein insertase